MLGGAIFRETLAAIRILELPAEAERDLLAVLEAGRSALAFINEAAYEPAADRDVQRRRAAGVYAMFCAGNLADDLIDDEVDYLPEPWRLGPSVQFMLQHLGTGLLLTAQVPPAVMARASFELVRAGSLGQVENRTTRWRLAPYKQVTEAVSGQQYVGFLWMLWHGTALADKAQATAMDLGVVVRVVKDISENKDRFFTMPLEERVAAVQWACAALDRAEASGVACAQLVVHSVREVLERASDVETIRTRPSTRGRRG